MVKCCTAFPLEIWTDIDLPRYKSDNTLKKGFHLSRACLNQWIYWDSFQSSVSLRKLRLWKDQSNKQGSLLTSCIPGTSALATGISAKAVSSQATATANRTLELGHMNILTLWASWSLSVSKFLCVKSHSPPSRRQVSTCQLLDVRGIPNTVSLPFHSITASSRCSRITPPNHMEFDSTLRKGSGK